MDPVTHTLLGVAVGEAFFRTRLGRRALPASALAANLPDIDGLVMVAGIPGSVALRRTFGHSLFLLPVWGAALVWLYKRRWPEASVRGLASLVAANVAGHLLFDLINSFGVVMLWPFSLARPELAMIFIIDPTLTGLLAAPHLARLKDAWRPRLPALSRAALIAAACYLVLAFAARTRATTILAREAPAGAEFRYVFPEPLGAHRWRGVAKENGAWNVYLIDVARGTAELRRSVPNAENHPAARAARETALGRRLAPFFKAPVWTVEKEPNGGSIATVHDLRFTSLVLPRRAPFSYVFHVDTAGLGTARAAGIW